MIYQAEEILWAQDVNGREGVFETAVGSEWENVLLTTPEDEAPPMAPSKVPLALSSNLINAVIITSQLCKTRARRPPDRRPSSFPTRSSTASRSGLKPKEDLSKNRNFQMNKLHPLKYIHNNKIYTGFES